MNRISNFFWSYGGRNDWAWNVWSATLDIRHPILAYRDWKKWRSRPRIGDYVIVHDSFRALVTGFGETEDDLQLEEAGQRISNESWMHCCGPDSTEWGSFPTQGHSYAYGQEPWRETPTSEDRFIEPFPRLDTE